MYARCEFGWGAEGARISVPPRRNIRICVRLQHGRKDKAESSI